MTDDRPPTTDPPSNPSSDPSGGHPGGHDDAEATIDVDPAWMAELRAAASTEAVEDRPDDDIESTIDASDELVASIRAGTAAADPGRDDVAAPDLAHLPPPPTTATPPPAATPPSTTPPATTPPANTPPPTTAAPAVAAQPAVRRWTPSDRLATRSALATNPYDDVERAPAPAPTPWKAIVVAVLVTAAVLVGAWAVFIRDDSSTPSPPTDSEPVAPSQPIDGEDVEAPGGDEERGDGG